MKEYQTNTPHFSRNKQPDSIVSNLHMPPQGDGAEDAADHRPVNNQLFLITTKETHASVNSVGGARRQRHQQHLYVTQVDKRVVLRTLRCGNGTSGRLESSPQGCANTKR